MGASSSRRTVKVAARFLKRVGRVAADAGQGFGHVGVLGRRGAAGGAVQEADRGTAQVEGVGGETAVALLGQEGRHVEREAGSGMRLMGGAPGAPGAHSGAVGAAGVVGLGAAAVARADSFADARLPSAPA